MVPGKPKVLWMMASPRRYIQPSHVIRIAPLIYGGSFRRDPTLAASHAAKVRSAGKLGYYWQYGPAADLQKYALQPIVKLFLLTNYLQTKKAI